MNWVGRQGKLVRREVGVVEKGRVEGSKLVMNSAPAGRSEHAENDGVGKLEGKTSSIGGVFNSLLTSHEG